MAGGKRADQKWPTTGGLNPRTSFLAFWQTNFVEYIYINWAKKENRYRLQFCVLTVKQCCRQYRVRLILSIALLLKITSAILFPSSFDVIIMKQQQQALQFISNVLTHTHRHTLHNTETSNIVYRLLDKPACERAFALTHCYNLPLEKC